MTVRSDAPAGAVAMITSDSEGAFSAVMQSEWRASSRTIQGAGSYGRCSPIAEGERVPAAGEELRVHYVDAYGRAGAEARVHLGREPD